MAVAVEVHRRVALMLSAVVLAMGGQGQAAALLEPLSHIRAAVAVALELEEQKVLAELVAVVMVDRMTD